MAVCSHALPCIRLHQPFKEQELLVKVINGWRGMRVLVLLLREIVTWFQIGVIERTIKATSVGKGASNSNGANCIKAKGNWLG